MSKDEKLIESILSASNELVCVVDSQAKRVFSSNAWNEVFENFKHPTSDSVFTNISQVQKDNAMSAIKHFASEQTSHVSEIKFQIDTDISSFQIEVKPLESVNDLYYVQAQLETKKSHIGLENINLKKALDAAGDLYHLGYWQIDNQTNEVHWSDEIYNIHGLDKENYQPELDSALSFYHPDDAPKVREKVERALSDGNEWAHSGRLVRPNGEERLVLVKGNPIVDESDGLISVVGTCQDITEYKSLENERNLLAAGMSESSAGVCITDAMRRVEWTNKAFEKLTGYSLEELKGNSLTNFLHGDKTDKRTVYEMRSTLEKGEAFQTDILNYRKDGQIYWCRLLIAPIYREGALRHFVGFQQDITEEIEAKEKLSLLNLKLEELIEQRTFELKTANEQLKELSRLDELTGCLTRRVFYEVYEIESARAKRENMEMSVAMIDIDHFKSINDRFGHPTGDKVLKAVVDEIHKAKRESDFLFRFGGEEFFLIMPSTNLQQAEMVAERIRLAIENLTLIEHEKVIRVTVSLGLLSTEGGAEASDVLRRSDELLYKAKSFGRNCVMS